MVLLIKVLLFLQDCFILDTAGSGLFVWIGRGCTKAEKLEAMNVAQKFLTEKGYPIWTKVNNLSNRNQRIYLKRSDLRLTASWMAENPRFLSNTLPAGKKKRQHPNSMSLYPLKTVASQVRNLVSRILLIYKKFTYSFFFRFRVQC